MRGTIMVLSVLTVLMAGGGRQHPQSQVAQSPPDSVRIFFRGLIALVQDTSNHKLAALLLRDPGHHPRLYVNSDTTHPIVLNHVRISFAWLSGGSGVVDAGQDGTPPRCADHHPPSSPGEADWLCWTPRLSELLPAGGQVDARYYSNDPKGKPDPLIAAQVIVTQGKLATSELIPWVDSVGPPSGLPRISVQGVDPSVSPPYEPRVMAEAVVLDVPAPVEGARFAIILDNWNTGKADTLPLPAGHGTTIEIDNISDSFGCKEYRGRHFHLFQRLVAGGTNYKDLVPFVPEPPPPGTVVPLQQPHERHPLRGDPGKLHNCEWARRSGKVFLRSPENRPICMMVLLTA